MWPLYKHLTGWSRTFRPPRAVTTAVSRRAVVAWVALCVGATAALLLAALLLPAAVWGICVNSGVCVYHMMFCEATRHHSAVRHPANFWSNLPYVYAALGMLCLAADERARRVARPYQLLDFSFALVLLGMAIASFGWHASNCTALHFVDIGLMNSVIAFFPLRFGFASAVHAMHDALRRRGALRLPETRAVTAAALWFYAAFVAFQFAWASEMTGLYHQAFPTGHSRFLTLKPVEIMIYIGLPGLYPLPVLWRMAQLRSWGCVPAIALSVVALPLGFCAVCVICICACACVCSCASPCA